MEEVWTQIGDGPLKKVGALRQNMRKPFSVWLAHHGVRIESVEKIFWSESIKAYIVKIDHPPQHSVSPGRH